MGGLGQTMVDVLWWTLASIGAGFCIDLLIGDPHWLPHPIRAIGALIAGLERGLRRAFPKTPRGERAAGVFLVILVLLVTAGVPCGILAGMWFWSPWAFFAVQTVMCWQILATRSLRSESAKVRRALERDDVEGARRAVSMIVGRDTERLDRDGIARAAVETVAENASDGVIAPLLYLFLGGAVLGFLYKGVNTMDSMVGYRNDRYENFGKAAARTDDVFNFLPSRISALLMIAGACFVGQDARNAWKIWRRDRRKHDSPNSAQTEAACAGALRLQLAGDAWYGGVLHEKPRIGDPLQPVRPHDILRAARLLYAAAILCLIVCGGMAAGLLFLFG